MKRSALLAAILISCGLAAPDSLLWAAGEPQLSGRWVSKVNGRKTGDCSIEQRGASLVLRIHRSPIERSEGRILDARTIIADQWGPQRGRVSVDGQRIQWQSSIWERLATPAPAPAPSGLAGRWEAWVGKRRTGTCSIQEGAGKSLVFIIHRSPPERSTGRFVDSRTVVADQWGPQRGRVSVDLRRIDWAGSTWKRVD